MRCFIKVSVFLVCMIQLSSTQEGLFGGFGQSGEGGLFGGEGQSGEGGPLINLLPFIGFGPFGAFGGYGLSGQQVAGGQSGTEAAAESAAEPAAESSGSRQPSLTDINMMLIWNQLLGANQGYNLASTSSLIPVQDPVTTNQPSQQEGSVSSNKPGQSNAGPYTNSDADMSWIHFFLQ